MAKKKETKQEPIEKQLWKAADKLRKNIDAAEYKHIVLGLIFLKYISDSFEELYAKLKKGEGEYAGADPEDRDEYRAENVFFVPPSARWSYLQGRAKLPEIGKDIDNSMDTIERDNPSLKGVLPKVYAKENLDPTSLGQLIDLISNIALGDEVSKSQDVLGKVYEYFLGEFALAEGKKGGQFYTPESIVKLLVEMLQPYKGRVFDPCCGSGGMFVQSEKFILAHQGKINDISIYGQESNQTTWRLAKMNLAIRGIDSSQVKWNNEGSFLNDAHKDLKADYIIANPPFNDSDWGGELLQKDARWQFGIPPKGNGNYAWVQHFLYHLAPSGRAGFVLANVALFSTLSGEDKIRQDLIKNDLVECIINLPTQLFYNTGLPASLWFFNRNKTQKGKVLFIDASKKGYMVDRTHRSLKDKDIQEIVKTYTDWLASDNYKDVLGYCKSTDINEIAQKDYVLVPGRYVGIINEENITPLSELIEPLISVYNDFDGKSKQLNSNIKKQFTKLGYNELARLNFIGLNSKLLISLISSIYQEWFVDFKLPVAFDSPKNFKHLEEVKVPKNWEYGKLENYCTIFRGASPRPITEPKYFSNGNIHWIKIADATSSPSIFIHNTKEYCTELAKTKSRYIEKGNLILSNSATIGVPMILNIDGCIHDGWLSFKDYKRITRNFLLFALSSKLQYLLAYADGSVQKNLNTGILKNLNIIVPPQDLLIEFDRISSPILELISLMESLEVKGLNSIKIQ
jgi:type I restriction enzyme M protein